jgi:hypothetical protein
MHHRLIYDAILQATCRHIPKNTLMNYFYVNPVVHRSMYVTVDGKTKIFTYRARSRGET